MTSVRAWSHMLNNAWLLVSNMSKEYGRPITYIKKYHPLGEFIALYLRFIPGHMCVFTNTIISSLAAGRPINAWQDIFLHFFATGPVNNLVKVWYIHGGYETHSFLPSMRARDGTLTVVCIAWQPDATYIILFIVREDGSICLHDLQSKTADEPLVKMVDHVSAFMCMVWSEEYPGLFIITGNDTIINTCSIE